MPYTHGQYTNVLKHFVYVSWQFGKQFDVAVSLNNDIVLQDIDKRGSVLTIALVLLSSWCTR